MFESALKGTKTKKAKGWKTFGRRDTARWKKEGSVGSMMRLRKGKVKVW